jgi:hypothetical protein
MKKFLLTVAAVLITVSPVLGQGVEDNTSPSGVAEVTSSTLLPTEATINEEQHQRLGGILSQLKILDTLSKNEEIDQARSQLLEEAGQIIGTQVSETVDVQQVYDLSYTSWSRKLGSYFSFINVLWVFVGLILLVAFLGIFGQYLWPLLVLLPPELLELGAWVLCLIAAFVSPYHWSSEMAFIAAMISIPFFAGLAAWRIWETSWRVYLGVLVLFIGAAAITHSSVFFGTLTVLTFMGLCGSWFVPFIEEISIFHDRQYVPSALATSSIMLAATLGLSLTSNPNWLGVFQYGVFWLAGLVFAGSLLALSCRHYYKKQNLANWLLWQVITITCGIFALYLGHVYAVELDSTVLQEIGGTFLAIYMIEKVVELPWDFKHWPWIALLIGVGGYYAVGFAASHPAYFLAF